MTDKEFRHYIDFLRLSLQRVIQDFQPDVIETERVWLMGYVLYGVADKKVIVIPS